ncbi:MAG: sulfatase-like hydrolase/transferase [Fimbriimonadaceae bacterium]|nr:sulfatase-like hydrolase/transferase [Fimbriimonadaceae bacterium]
MLDRRSFLQLTAAGAGLAAAGGLRGQAPRRPNVVVIVTDDQGSADVGFRGCRDIPTPHLDSLAANGVVCRQAYVSHPFCSPTRAGLLTGRYQQRFGHENNPAWLPADTVAGLPVDQVTLADTLRGAGYATGAVGKWHLGAAPCFHPLRRGFQEYFGIRGGGHDYFRQQLTGEAREYLIPLDRNGESVAETEYLTDAFSREAGAFVDRHAAEPFFLYLAYNAPHTPLQAPPEDLARFAAIADPKRRTYAAMLSRVDAGVGRLLATLRARQVLQDTLIVYFSDNGGPLGEKGNASGNAPLRAGKGSCYEGGVRTPWAMQWPARLTAGRVYDQPVISLDVFATAAAAAGAKVPHAIDGVDLLPHLTGANPAPPHERLHWRSGPSWALREGDWKVVKPGQGAPQLFDLAADPAESRDLAAAQPERLARLTATHDAWNAELRAPLFRSPQG